MLLLESLKVSSLLQSPSAGLAIQLILVAWLMNVLATVVYRLFFHPLAHVPGPALAALSDLPFLAHFYTGKSHVAVLRWHEKYGEVVRIGPDELSFNSDQGWKDIYSANKTRTFVKDRYHVARPITKVVGKGIVASSGKDHTRQRRLLSHAFSETSLRQQEPLITQIVDLFMHKIDQQWAVAGEFDANKWFNLLTFDIAGDLAFGEPFGCLENDGEQRYTILVGEAMTTTTKLNILRRLWIWRLWFPAHTPAFLISKLRALQMMAKDKLDRRLQRTAARPDLIGHILTHKTEELTMDDGELRANASTFISAGSETTANALTGITYYLSLDPERQEKLRAEINATFASDETIGFAKAAKMEYLNAVIQEGLRLFPPLPGGLTREATEDTFVCGLPVAKGTIVSSHLYASANDERNFKDATVFIPERWLPDASPRYASDSLGASQPFSAGARGCIGKNLAYAEMRLTLCRLLRRYRVDFASPSEAVAHWNPATQTAHLLWDRESLHVRLNRLQEVGDSA